MPQLLLLIFRILTLSIGMSVVAFLVSSPKAKGGGITPIGDINDLNTDGTGVSVGQLVTIQGVVHCIDFFEGDGMLFWLLEPNGDGINVFSSGAIDDYQVTEGDELIIEGEVSQFQGLLEFFPSTITIVSQGNELVAPRTISSLAEEHESNYVTLEITRASLQDIQIRETSTSYILDFEKNSGGLTLVVVPKITGISESFLRAYIESPSVLAYRIQGIVSQDDPALPWDDFYYLLPCAEASFDYLTTSSEPSWGKNLSIFPTPSHDFVRVQAEVKIQEWSLLDRKGQLLFRGTTNKATIEVDLNALAQGQYYLQLLSNEEFVLRPLIKH